MSTSDEKGSEATPELLAAVLEAESSLLPTRSRTLYEKTYAEFEEWCRKNSVPGQYNSNVVLCYFAAIAKMGKIASLWPKFSMLKATINLKHNVDIGKYYKVVQFIKRQNEGYIPKKSNVLEKENVIAFLCTAPDHDFLSIKVHKYIKICLNIISNIILGVANIWNSGCFAKR